MGENRKYIKYIVKLLSPYKKKVVCLTVLMFLTAIGNMIIPLTQQQIIDVGISNKDIKTLFFLVLLSIFVCVIIAFLSYLQNKIQVVINCDFQKSLQIQAIKHLQKIKKSILDQEGVVKLTKNVDYCVETLVQITGNSVLLLFVEIFKLIGIVIALVLINWQLAIYILTLIPVRLLIASVSAWINQRYAETNIKKHQVLHQWEEDLYSTIPEIKLHNLYELKNSEYKDIISSIMETIKKSFLLSAKDMYIGSGVSQALYQFLYLIAGVMIWKENLTIGGLLVIAGYYMYVIDPIDLFSNIGLVFSNVKPAIDKYEEFMNLQEENEILKKDNEVCKSHIILSMEGVSFSYDEHQIFDKVNIVFEKNKKYAIVGENGSGKSTLLDLILRFKDIQSGNIKYKNIDIRDLGVSQLREKFGVVTQQSNLFYATIRDNITLFGKNIINYHVKENELFSFIYNLPNGLDSDVGSKATQLSGGEKQKISLARALSQNPEILLLDEPTSNYDFESKMDFYKLISKLECTVIVISHDPEILEIVDEIILLNDGEVNQFSTYKDYLGYNFQTSDIDTSKMRE